MIFGALPALLGNNAHVGVIAPSGWGCEAGTALNGVIQHLRVAAELIGTTYGELSGLRITPPADPQQKPSLDALARHLEWSGIVDQG